MPLERALSVGRLKATGSIKAEARVGMKRPQEKPPRHAVVEALEAFESVRRREEGDERETAQGADREESESEPPEVTGGGPRSAGRSFRQSQATHEAPRRSRSARERDARAGPAVRLPSDWKSTRLNSSHLG